jgi:uncharacterized damage-inducible protein DinB
MSNLALIRSFYEYNYWCIQQVLASAAQLEPAQVTAETLMPHASLWATLFHTLDAEWLWIERCRGISPKNSIPEPPIPSLQTLAATWAGQQTTTLAFLGSLDEPALARVVNYSSLRGAPRSSLLWHLLLHVATHTVQHRAEAAQILTQFGQSPGDLDFDDYVAERPA